MKNKKSIKCFGFLTMLLHINMKNYENIACTFFVNVNIALTARKIKILLVPVN